MNSGKAIQELPFTGLETLWLALVGGGMLGLGLFLRLRLSKAEEIPAPVTDADPPAVDAGEAREWRVPELGIAPSTRGRGVHLPFSEFESLGRMLIEQGKARARAGPTGALLVVLDTG